MAAVIALLPYVNDFFITAYVGGAIAAVWFAIRRHRQLLTFKEGAELGFQSGFYGILAATTIYELSGSSFITSSGESKTPIDYWLSWLGWCMTPSRHRSGYWSLSS